jgi:hypothetical protein
MSPERTTQCRPIARTTAHPAPLRGSREDWPDIRRHALRCRPALARLHRLSHLESSAPLPPSILAEGRAAVDQIQAELDEALSVFRAAGTDGNSRRLLIAWVTRLRRAADAIGRALEHADKATKLPDLRERLTHFDALSAALWTVQLGLSNGSRAARPATMRSARSPVRDVAENVAPATSKAVTRAPAQDAIKTHDHESPYCDLGGRTDQDPIGGWAHSAASSS